MAILNEQFERLLYEVLPVDTKDMLFDDGIVRPNDANKYSRDRLREFFSNTDIVPKHINTELPANDVQALKAQIEQGGTGVIRTPQLMISGNIDALKAVLNAPIFQPHPTTEQDEL